MELKSLCLGIFFSTGIFAFKSGIGLFYFYRQKHGIILRALLILIYCISYFILFIFIKSVVEWMDISLFFEKISKMIKNGVLIHFSMALLMLIWGIVLLKGNNLGKIKKLGWVTLIFPCPVCVTSIFISMVFLLSYFPDSKNLVILSVYSAFLAAAFTAIPIMAFLEKKSDQSPGSILGFAMVIIALYFVFSAVIMPQFGDIDKIYRLAAYKGDLVKMQTHFIIAYILIITGFFISGFFIMNKKINRTLKWK
ncbi:MAG: hypothetical protein KAQ72_12280 [Desulfobacula sp.]|nr:hypothetical protein [Desulfobacula sp.]